MAPSAEGEGIAAVWFDGTSPIAKRVTAAAAADGLRIDGQGASRRFAYADLKLIAYGRDEVRLGLRAEPDARLLISAVDAAAIARFAPRLFDRGQARARAGLQMAGLAAAGCGLIALLFIGAPMAAPPLAQATPRTAEAQMGENLAAQVNLVYGACSGPAAEAAAEALAATISRLAAAADPGFPVTVSFVLEDSPNALALPGGGVIITQGLLETLTGPDELTAVLAHEMGHVAARDGMTALYRTLGLGVMLDVLTGGSGIAQQAMVAAGQLADLSHTRAQEARADDYALAALAAAGEDPAALARAFRALQAWEGGDDGPGSPEASDGRLALPEWLSSHPDLDARIARAEAQARPPAAARPPQPDWAVLQLACADTPARRLPLAQ